MPLQLSCHFAFVLRMLFHPQALPYNTVFDIDTRQACQKDDPRKHSTWISTWYLAALLRLFCINVS